MKSLTRNWRDHKRDRHTQTHGNWIEIFRYSLSIEEDGRASRNISIQFPCVCVCLSLLWSLQFLVRVYTFLSLNLWFSYFPFHVVSRLTVVAYFQTIVNRSWSKLKMERTLPENMFQVNIPFSEVDFLTFFFTWYNSNMTFLNQLK